MKGPIAFASGVWLSALSVLLLQCSGGTEETERDSRVENVVLVSFDALRADHLGAYGYAKNTSPSLDAFAKQSVVFTRSFSQCGSTTCSFASLMTSKYPATDQVLKNARLPTGETTLAEILSETMNTAAVISNRFLTRKFGQDQGFESFDEEMAERFESAAATGVRAMKMLRRLQSESQPFFLWVHFRPPHAPYEPPREFFDEFYPNPEALPTVLGMNRLELLEHYLKSELPVRKTIFGRKHTVTKTILEQYEAGYDGNIKAADVEFGRIWDFLVATGAAEKTLVIFTSDHGENLGEHGYFDHNNLYYGTIHTPLIVYSPHQAPRIVEDLVENVDILPTVLDSLGMESHHSAADLRGQSLWSPARDKEFSFSEFSDKAVIAHDHLLIFGDGGEQLFDLNADPDVEIGDPDGALVGELKNIYFERVKAGRPGVKDETLDDLRSLGYIE